MVLATECMIRLLRVVRELFFIIVKLYPCKPISFLISYVVSLYLILPMRVLMRVVSYVCFNGNRKLEEEEKKKPKFLRGE